MNRLLFFLGMFSVSTGFAAPVVSIFIPAPAADDVLLAAIAEVETGNNSAALGHLGERTRLQILPETWRRYSHLPLSMAATNPTETNRVARAYLESIRRRLHSRGLPETPFFIAAGWNAGPGWRTLSPGTVSYAERVSNLVEAIEAKSGAAHARPTAPVRHLASADDYFSGGAMVVALNSSRPLFHLAASN